MMCHAIILVLLPFLEYLEGLGIYDSYVSSPNFYISNKYLLINK